MATIFSLKQGETRKSWTHSTPLKSLIQERQQVFHKEHRSRRWKRLRNKVRYAIIKAKKDYYRNRVQHHKKANPAEWYKQIEVMANLNKAGTTIQPPPHVDDSSDLKAVAASINSHFVSIYNDLQPLSISDLPSYRPDPEPSPSVQEFEVYNMLRKTKAGKAGGPDGVSSRIIREFAFELSKPYGHFKPLVGLYRRRCSTAVEKGSCCSNSQGKARQMRQIKTCLPYWPFRETCCRFYG